MHLAVDHRRQPGVGQARDGHPAVGSEVSERLAHLNRAGGAVEADHVDLHCVERGEGGRDLGAGQHAARELDGHLDLERDLAPYSHHGATCRTDGCLGAEQVEHRLDDQQVDAAFEQAGCLLFVGVAQGGERRLAEGGELGARPHRPGDEFRPVRRRVLVGQAPGQGRGGHVELVGALGQVVLGKYQGERAEAVGLDHVDADVEERAVEGLDHIGARRHEDLVAPLELRATEVVGSEVSQLQVGAGGAVEDEDALGEGAQVRRGARIQTSEQCGGCRHDQ